jgi:hypothetical protein
MVIPQQIVINGMWHLLAPYDIMYMIGWPCTSLRCCPGVVFRAYSYVLHPCPNLKEEIVVFPVLIKGNEVVIGLVLGLPLEIWFIRGYYISRLTAFKSF